MNSYEEDHVCNYCRVCGKDEEETEHKHGCIGIQTYSLGNYPGVI